MPLPNDGWRRAAIALRVRNTKFKKDRSKLTDFWVNDSPTEKSRAGYALCVGFSEGAMFEGGEMVFQKYAAPDAFGHKKTGGHREVVAEELNGLFAEIQQREKIEVQSARAVVYLVRCGEPDRDRFPIRADWRMANLALDLLPPFSKTGIHGRWWSLKERALRQLPIENGPTGATKNFQSPQRTILQQPKPACAPVFKSL